MFNYMAALQIYALDSCLHTNAQHALSLPSSRMSNTFTVVLYNGWVVSSLFNTPLQFARKSSTRAKFSFKAYLQTSACTYCTSI